jgi:hypothetical protein
MIRTFFVIFFIFISDISGLTTYLADWLHNLMTWYPEKVVGSEKTAIEINKYLTKFYVKIFIWFCFEIIIRLMSYYMFGGSWSDPFDGY